MTHSQDDIDALLAEMDDLANEAAAALVAAEGDLNEPGSSPAQSADTPRQSRKTAGAPSRPARAPRRGDPNRILKIEVPVIVQLASCSMKFSKVMTLSLGSIIEFEKPFDAQLDLMINNKIIGIGQAVKVGERFGLRVTRIGSVKSRIEAMGPV